MILWRVVPWVGAVLLVLLCLPVSAVVPTVREHDILILHTGVRIEGIIDEAGSDGRTWVVQRTDRIIQKIARDDVAQVLRRHQHPRDAYDELMAGEPDLSPTDRMELASWCRQRQLEREGLGQLRQVVEEQPAHQAAYELAAAICGERQVRLAPAGPGAEQEWTGEQIAYFAGNARAAGLTVPALELLRARVLEQVGFERAAREEYQALLDATDVPQTVREARVALARLQLQAHQSAAALATLEEIVADTAPLHRLKGDAAYGAGRLKEARRHWQRASEMDPGDPALRLRLAVAGYLAGELTTAARELEGIVGAPDLSPSDQVRARYYYGLVLARQQQTEEAAAIFDSLAQEPGDGPTRADLGQGFLHLLAGRSAEALAAFRSATGRTPLGPLAMQAHVLRASLLREQDLAEATRAMQAAAQAGLDPVQGFGTLALWYGEANRPAEARRFLRYALALRPGDPDLSYQLARTLLQLEEWTQAEALFGQLLQDHPGHRGALAGLAWLRYREGRYRAPDDAPGDGAEDYFRALRGATAASQDTFGGYAEWALEQMRRARTRVVLTDTFRRPGSEELSSVRNNWQEIESSGVLITLRPADHVVRFEGTTLPDEMVSLSRDITGQEFPWLRSPEGGAPRRGTVDLVELEARLRCDQADGLHVGIRLESENGGSVRLYRTANGYLAYNFTKRGKVFHFAEAEDPAARLLPAPLSPGYHTLAIELDEEERNLVRLRVDGRTRPEWSFKHPGFSGTWRVSVFAVAPVAGSGSWEVQVDEVTVFVKKPGGDG